MSRVRARHARVRRALVGAWLSFLAAALYLFFFQRAFVSYELHVLLSTPSPIAGALYLLIGCLRGFTFIPVTTLLVAAMPFFPPVPLFVLTIVGILVSSASVYYFSEALHVEELLARRYQKRMTELEGALRKYELPVITAWSFFPLVPTDVICYVCGVMKVDIRKVMGGVALGEGAMCAIYVFLGDQALRSLGLRP